MRRLYFEYDDIMNVFFAQYDFVSTPLTEKGRFEDDF